MTRDVWPARCAYSGPSEHVSLPMTSRSWWTWKILQNKANSYCKYVQRGIMRFARASILVRKTITDTRWKIPLNQPPGQQAWLPLIWIEQCRAIKRVKKLHRGERRYIDRIKIAQKISTWQTAGFADDDGCQIFEVKRSTLT